ncbi:Asp/Glu racemase [Vibrio campbellii]|uniref:maleate cis-trans isomerase family protein n=1 Tax=Vibrio sp. LB10LO1 TaxID=2711207 RepID=UPI001389E18A|nr:aspartate/glutamate racemase family protein [Vibrio sp. LB10LO1]NDJ80414.1 Asp/Glu racemase [Vibrio sp. LB10LO1]
MEVGSVALQNELDNLASAGRVGVISLATDFNIENDLRQLFPQDVASFTSRVRNYNPLTIENLRRMEPGIQEVADTILPGTALDVVIYACTSGTIAIGEQRIIDLIQAHHPDAKVTNPVTAALAAFERLNIKRVSIVTPYTQAVNQDVAAFFSTVGLEVLNIVGFDFEDDTAMTFISPNDIAHAAIQACHPDADAVFISCTALRATTVIHDIEAAINKPVLSSNQVLAWHALALLNYPKHIEGFGLLLEQHLPLNL